MSSLYSTLGMLAGATALVEFALYILAIYGRDYQFRSISPTSPNRATWFIWAFLGIITAVSYHASGATDTIWFPVAYAIGFVIVAILSLKHGEGGFTTIDLACFAGAILSVLLWWRFNSPEVALYATLAIDACGVIPTLRKSWRKPLGENRLAWTVTVFACILNLFALNWNEATFAVIIYPVYMLIANGIIMMFLYFRAPQSKLL